MPDCCELVGCNQLRPSSGPCRTQEDQPVMNDVSAVNEKKKKKKSTSKPRAPNAPPYRLLTGANPISMALTETNHTFPAAATTQLLRCNKFLPLIKQ